MKPNPQRVRELFVEAVGQVAPERWDAYLEVACDSDPELIREVRQLLAVHRDAGSCLAGPAVGLVDTLDRSLSSNLASETATLEAPGASIGPYQLIERLGEGGMGVVYRAEQTHPVHREVALKVVKPGMDTKQVVARFEVERQALALMDHPNIARVFEAGATESGRPYFVMELVAGIPITDYCDQNHLTIAERLDLFVLVCRAVQHAHQKGIIHRDLKPSNVLVALQDGVPVPKVIDFGIAKAIGRGLTGEATLTGLTQIIGTPLYMSPEQADLNGCDIDTRSDVYSLGVLLYELLTGTTPFEPETFRKAALGEICQIVREHEPPRPSSRLSTLTDADRSTVSANRQTDPRRLSRAVHGELDWIVMKCLEKDRARRYETVSAFADDLMRFLTDRPVEAGPPAVSYRFSKFARRNRVAFTTAGLVVLALLLGTAVSTWQAVRAMAAEGRAEERRLLARQALDDLYDEVAARWSSYHTMWFAPLPRPFLEKALPFYEGFADPHRVDPAVGRAHRRVGEILFQLNSRDKSVVAFRRAEAIFQALLVVDPENLAHLDDLSYCYADMSLLGELGDTHPRITAWQEDLVQRFPEVSHYQLQLAATHLGRGVDAWGYDDLARADHHLRRACAVLEPLSSAEPSYPEARNVLGHALRDLANAHRDLGRTDDDEPRYRRALALHEALVARYPTRPQYLLNLGWDCWELSRLLLRAGRDDEADRLSVRTASIMASLGNDYPDVYAYKEYEARALAECAAVRIRTGRPAEAETIIGRLDGLENHWLASQCLGQVAWYLIQEDGHGPADPARSVALARQALSHRPESIDGRHLLGLTLYRAGDWDAAIAALEPVPDPVPGSAYRLSKGLAYNGFFMAMAHFKQGNHEKARTWYDRSTAWMAEHDRYDPILLRYRAEAAAVLGLDADVMPNGGAAFAR